MLSVPPWPAAASALSLFVHFAVLYVLRWILHSAYGVRAMAEAQVVPLTLSALAVGAILGGGLGVASFYGFIAIVQLVLISAMFICNTLYKK